MSYSGETKNPTENNHEITARGHTPVATTTHANAIALAISETKTTHGVQYLQIRVTTHGTLSQVMRELFNMHPRAASKKGPGIKSITFGFQTKHQNQCCFFIQRVDGTSDDFSVRKCIKKIRYPIFIAEKRFNSENELWLYTKKPLDDLLRACNKNKSTLKSTNHKQAASSKQANILAACKRTRRLNTAQESKTSKKVPMLDAKVKAAINAMVREKPVRFSRVIEKLKLIGIMPTKQNVGMTTGQYIRQLGFTVKPLPGGNKSDHFCWNHNNKSNNEASTTAAPKSLISQHKQQKQQKQQNQQKQQKQQIQQQRQIDLQTKLLKQQRHQIAMLKAAASNVNIVQQKSPAVIVELMDVFENQEEVHSSIKRYTRSVQQLLWVARAQKDTSNSSNQISRIKSDAQSKLCKYMNLLTSSVEKECIALIESNADLIDRKISDIQIFPSANEMRNGAPNLLPLLDRSTDVCSHIASHFHILRQDFFEPLRKEIMACNQTSRNDQRGRTREPRKFTNVTVVGLRGGKDKGLVMSLRFKSPFRNETWKKLCEANALMPGGLICLARKNDSNFVGELLWATVVRSQRDDGVRVGQLKDGLVEVQPLFLQKKENTEVRSSLLNVFETVDGHRTFVEYSFIEAPEYFEPYKRVLNTLKSMDPNADVAGDETKSDVRSSNSRSIQQFPIPDILDHLVMNRNSDPCGRPDYLSRVKDTQSEADCDTMILAQRSDLSIGSRVRAPWKHQGTRYDGSISSLTASGNYNINFDDGDQRKDVPLEEIWIPNNSGPVRSTIETPLDHSQLSAINHVLSSRIAIVQGPPGTGKTHVAVAATLALLERASAYDFKPLVVIAYTNHALDQFLRKLYEKSPQKDGFIKRCGGGSKPEDANMYAHGDLRESLKGSAEYRQLKRTEFELFEMLKSIDNKDESSDSDGGSRCFRCNQTGHFARDCPNGQRSKSPSSILQAYDEPLRLENFVKIRTELEKNAQYEEASTIDIIVTSMRHEKKLREQRCTILVQFRQVSNDSSSQQWKEVKAAKLWLEKDVKGIKSVESSPSTWHVAFNTEKDAQAVIHKFSQKDRTNNGHRFNFLIMSGSASVQNNNDGWTTVKSKHNRRKSAKAKDNIITSWTQGQPSVDKNSHGDHCKVWTMPVQKRLELYQKMQEHNLNIMEKISQQDWEQYNQIAKLIEVVRQKKRALEGKQFKVIGMTTSFAAGNRELLEQIKPAVMLVEEAAEVLESHILAAIPSSLQHLVLIGDHKQLQPSTASYVFAKEHGLNRSLFERLIDCGVEHKMLRVQRRARPELARLVQSVYDPIKIQDGDNVNFDKVHGLQHSRFFFDHQWEEDNQQEGSSSRSNLREARMAVCLAKYILQQGQFQAEDITLLTFYGGQQRLLKKELERIGCSASVRVKTVDDFQGEESEIVILSLVRSNDRGDIGHCKIAHRVCVALSRARKGLYILGNTKCVQNSRFDRAGGKGRLIWNHALQLMRRDGQVGDAFPLTCHHHPENPIVYASTVNDLNSHVCTIDSWSTLSCGHMCCFKCHHRCNVKSNACGVCALINRERMEALRIAEQNEVCLARQKAELDARNEIEKQQLEAEARDRVREHEKMMFQEQVIKMEAAGIAEADALNNLSMEQLLRAVSSNKSSSQPEWLESTDKNILGGETKSSLATNTCSDQDTKYTLLPTCSGVRETMEFNMAAMQFVKLTGRSHESVTKVEVYDCAAVKIAFNKEKRELTKRGRDEEKWVFHGTPDQNNVPLIMTTGFKVGGADVAIANGDAYGRGVYTALGPSTPMGYAGGTGRVILARGLLGENGAQSVGDSWSPNRDWVIFRRGSQLLPRYVVHFS